MSKAADTVGVVGLGRIGGSVAKALAGSGLRVLVNDVSEQAVAALGGAVESCPSPRVVGERAPVVLVAVYDDEQVREVVSSLLEGDPLPRTIVVLSTITLETVRWAVEQAGARGVELLDCGVTGGQGLRSQGKIVVLAGGSEDAIERVRPVLEVFAAPLLHMGPSGAGMQAKLARNLIHYCSWYAAWEGARLAAAAGVDVGKLVEACRASDVWSGGATGLLARGIGPGPAGSLDGEQRRSREYTAHVAEKDLGYALELAQEVGVTAPGAELVRERMELVLGLEAEDEPARAG